MLRRRRSLACPTRLSPPKGSLQKCRKKENLHKLKMSPYPETRGVSLPLGAIENDYCELKMALQFADVEEASSVLGSPDDNAHKEGIPGADSVSRSGGKKKKLLKCDQLPDSNLKPTSMLELDRNMTSSVKPRRVIKARSTKKSGGVGEEGKGEPSAQVKGVWDSVVSWMKMAVDYIALDSTVEALPHSQPHGRKRMIDEMDFEGPPAKMKHPRTPGSSKQLPSDCGRAKSKRRKSFGGFTAPSGLDVNSGLGQVLKLEPIPEDRQSDSTLKASAVPSEFHFSTMKSPGSSLASDMSTFLSLESPSTRIRRTNGRNLKQPLHLQPSQNGLNSILDGFPSDFHAVLGGKMKIKRQSLRNFYGNSVNSPNLTEVPSTTITVRRSPRLNKGIPAAPPPPPVPSAPPPPPSFSAVPKTNKNPSLDLLNQMQSRLRSRIKRKIPGEKGVEPPGEETVDSARNEDIKVKQWGEIQARSRKLSYTDFLSLAERKRQQLVDILQELEEGKSPLNPESVLQMVETLHDAATWFPGGNKEMRESISLYKKLEKKIEVLNEYVQVSEEMNRALVATRLDMQRVRPCNYISTMLHVREDFDAKHRHWGAILTSNGDSWKGCGLPVCYTLLTRSCDHLCELVNDFVDLSLEEASRLTNHTKVAVRCIRRTQLKEKLKECLQLMTEAQNYFSLNELQVCNTSCCSSCNTDCPTSQPVRNQDSKHSLLLEEKKESCNLIPQASNEDQVLCRKYNSKALLSLAAEVALSYVNIALQQFDSMASSSRQRVCEHFEGILKVLSLVKGLIPASQQGPSCVGKSAGVLSLLPDGENLGEALYDTCVKLIQHIMDQQLHMASPTGNSKEMVLWMMFSCKYVNQILEFLGSEQANQRGVVDLLEKLQQVERLLPEF